MKSITRGSLCLLIVFIIMLPENLVFSQDKMKKHEEMAQEFIESAKSLREVGDHKNAVIMLKQAYLLYPNSPTVLYSIAYSYEEIGECTHAYEWYSRTLLHHKPEKLTRKAKRKATEFLTSRIDCRPIGDDKLYQSYRQLLADSAKLYLEQEFTEAEKVLKEALLQIETTEIYLRLALLGFLDSNCEKMQDSLDKASKLGKLDEYVGVNDYFIQTLECKTVISDNSNTQSEPEKQVTDSKVRGIIEKKGGTKTKIVQNKQSETTDLVTDENNNGVGTVIELDKGPSVFAWITGGIALNLIVLAILVYVDNKDVPGPYDQALFNVSLGAGVGLGVTSVLLFIFTRGKKEKEQFSVTPIFSPSGSGLAIEGSF